MCDYSGINDAQRYTREELTPEEVERRIRNIIKVGHDEELKLKIPMFENGSCPEVNQPSFHYYRLLFESIPYFDACRSPHFLFPSLVPSSATRGLKSLQMTKRRHPLLQRNSRPRQWREMQDPLKKNLWRRSLW
jgi:hypothetical protein